MAKKVSQLAEQKAEESKVQSFRDKNDAAKAECMAQHSRHQLSKLRLEAEHGISLITAELDHIKEPTNYKKPYPQNRLPKFNFSLGLINKQKIKNQKINVHQYEYCQNNFSKQNICS